MAKIRHIAMTTRNVRATAEFFKQAFGMVEIPQRPNSPVEAATLSDGYINELSKQVVGGLGEAVGINFIGAEDKATLIRRLAEVSDQDYFERGIELAIEKDGLRVEALDISQFHIVEVDHDEDLSRANEFVGD